MAPKPRGHRQRGAGTVTVSRGEQLRQGVLCKEWQRTPVQLLQDFCQAKKRARPQFQRVRAADGSQFRARCVLPDDKNAARDLAFCPEQSFETLDEARHCAALLALKHLEPTRPHERKLPDPYRDLWLSLAGPDEAGKPPAGPAAKTSAKAKKKDPKASAAPEPAQKEAAATNGTDMDLWADAGDNEQDEGDAKKSKKTLPLELSSDRKFASQAEFDQARRERVEERNRRQRSRENRERANIPKSVMMSVACREQIEQVLRELGSIAAPSNGSNSGNLDFADSTSIGATTSTIDMDKVVKELRAVGFQEKHCANVLRICQPDPTTVTTADYVTKTLDWLCLNIPEAELPKQFNPEGTQLDVVLASRDMMPTGSSAVLVQRLMKFGFGRTDAIHVSNEFIREHGDVVIAEDSPMFDVIQKLLQMLSPKMHSHFEIDDEQVSDAVPDDEEILAMRQDEIFALEAIYDDKLLVQQIGEDDYKSQLVQLEATDGVKLHIFLPADSKYPFELPLLAVTSPSPDHQSYLLGATGHALQSCKMSIGEPMLYDLYVAVDSLLQDKFSLQKQPANHQIQLFAPPSAEKITPPPAPTDASTSKAKTQRQGKSKARQQGRRQPPRTVDKEATRRLSEMLLTRRQEKEVDKGFRQMIKSRATLPAHKEKDHVLECVRSNQVTLVCGQTGCGKTTQVPQFILDEYIERGAGGECQIICTQPRRIAAIGVATRVAQERCEQIADVVGYQIRMDAKKSANTRLLFCTTGVLLRRLLSDRALSGVTHVIVDEVHERNIDTDFLLSVLRDLLPYRPELRVILMSATMNAELFVKYFSTPSKPPCPVLDIPGFTFPVECHFLEDIVGMASYDIPRKLLTKKSKPAADDQGEEPKGKPSSTELVARMDDSRIDYDLIAHLVNYLLTSATPRHEGAILIFLPGTAEIKRLMEMLNQSSSISSRIWVLALHGSLSGADQSLVFKSSPSGKTKIIVSTNIAETSITINDITAVIDCGKVKEMVYDNQQRRSQLLDCWASRAACDQRKGRAGRVQSGTCYRLFSRKRFQAMDAQLAAEIHRVSLEQLCLQIKKLELGSIRGFLAKAIEPPKEEAVTAAIQELVEIAAFQHIADLEEDSKDSKKRIKGRMSLTNDEEVVLTPLGSHLAMLPLDARIGKFLVYGSILRCIEPVAIIAACISSKNPFVMSMSDPELREKQEAFKKGLGAQNWKSDHLLLWKVVDTYAATARGQKLKRAFCRDNGLSYDTLETIIDLKAQYLQQLDAIGFYEAANAEYLNANSTAPRIIKAALCAGLYANVARVLYPEQKYFQSAHGAFTEAHDAKKIRYFIRSRQEGSECNSAGSAPRDERVFLHPSSSNFSQQQYDSPWLLFTELVQTSKLFVRESTMVNPYALLLFGGRIDVMHDRGLLTIDNWISFHAVARIGVLIKAVRQHLDRLLRAKIEDPGVDIARSELVTAISHLLKSEGM